MHQDQESTAIDTGIGRSVDLIALISKGRVSLFALSENQQLEYHKDFSFPSDSLEMVNEMDRLDIRRKITISSAVDFTFVPSSLSEEGDHRSWLLDLPGKKAGDIVLKDRIPALDMNVFFSIPTSEYEFFSQISPHQKIEHLAAVLIKSASDLSFASVWSKMVCFFLEGKMFVMAYKNNEVRLANFYHYQLPADALYYILWARKEVFGSEEVPVFVNGFIHNKSKLFKELKSYIKEIHLGCKFNQGKIDSDEKGFDRHSFELLLGS